MLKRLLDGKRRKRGGEGGRKEGRPGGQNGWEGERAKVMERKEIKEE